MNRSRGLASVPLVFALGIAPVAALEAPLSRASFERAIEEGRSCKRMEKAGPYVIVKRGTESFLATIVDDLLQHYSSEEVSDSYVTVRLATPYTRVRYAACTAKLLGTSFDEEAAWEAARQATTVALLVETRTVSEPTTPMSVDAEDKYGPSGGTLQSAGPRVKSAAVRRGDDDKSPLVQPVGEIGPEYEFPATALQGEGRFFLVLRTEAPDGQVTLKLKPSVLRKP